jgi:hypothetical protein
MGLVSSSQLGLSLQIFELLRPRPRWCNADSVWPDKGTNFLHRVPGTIHGYGLTAANSLSLTIARLERKVKVGGFDLGWHLRHADSCAG